MAWNIKAFLPISEHPDVTFKDDVAITNPCQTQEDKNDLAGHPMKYVFTYKGLNGKNEKVQVIDLKRWLDIL